MPFFSPSMQPAGGGPQVLSTQLWLSQSVSTTQAPPSAQGEQTAPPQSVSLSSPFFSPSAHWSGASVVDEVSVSVPVDEVVVVVVVESVVEVASVVSVDVVDVVVEVTGSVVVGSEVEVEVEVVGSVVDVVGGSVVGAAVVCWSSVVDVLVDVSEVLSVSDGAGLLHAGNARRAKPRR